ncbi:MAG: hypothetical protein FWG07_02130 [Treponema sp.]|nr:hypothetical protein [Treponema sp.]
MIIASASNIMITVFVKYSQKKQKQNIYILIMYVTILSQRFEGRWENGKVENGSNKTLKRGETLFYAKRGNSGKGMGNISSC